MLIKTLILGCFANIVATYLAATFASPGEGWRQPQRAVLAGLVGGLLYFGPILLTMQPGGYGYGPQPSPAGFWAGVVLSTVWYTFAFVSFYGFGFAQLVLCFIGLQLASWGVSKALSGGQ